MPTLHLICGLPGSGKTTFGKKLERDLGAVRFSPDERLSELGIDGFDTGGRAEVELAQWEEAKAALRAGRSVVLENGFWERTERDRLRGEARTMGVEVKLHYLDVPLEELKRRLAMRNEDIPEGSFHVNPAMLDHWAAMFEPPGGDELE